MTLNTRIAVTEPVPLHELFRECRHLIGAEGEQWRWEDREGYDKDGSRTLAMVGGQGLPGWLMIDYHPDKPLRINDGERYFPDSEEDEDESDQKRPRCAYEVSLDTAYGYRGPNGEGCTELHASFVVRLAAWLLEQGSGCCWQNEFSGEWAAPDNPEAFRAFLGDGDNANDWFRGTVWPAILSGAVSSAEPFNPPRQNP